MKLPFKSLLVKAAKAIIRKHGHELEQKAIEQLEKKLHAAHEKAATDDGA